MDHSVQLIEDTSRFAAFANDAFLCLKNEIESLTGEIEEKENEVQGLKDQVRIAEVANETTQECIKTSFESILVALGEKQANIRDIYKQPEQSRLALFAARALTNIENLKRAKLDCEGKLMHVTGQLERREYSTDKIRQTLRKYEDAESRNGTLKTQIQALKLENDRLKAHVKLEQENRENDRRNMMNALEKTKELAAKELASLVSTKKLIDEEKDALLSKSNEATERLQERVTLLESQLKSGAQTISTLEARLEKSEEACIVAESKFSNLQQDLQTVKTEVEQKDSEILQVKTRLKTKVNHAKLLTQVYKTVSEIRSSDSPNRYQLYRTWREENRHKALG